MRRRNLMLFGCAVLTAAMVAGCSANKGTADTTAAAQESSITEETTLAADQKEDTVTVKVVSVDGDTVTAEVGEIKTMEMPGGPGAGGQGGAPEKPGDTGNQGGAPEKPGDAGNQNGAPEKPGDAGDHDGASEKPDHAGDQKAPGGQDGSGDHNGKPEGERPDGQGAPDHQGGAPDGQGAPNGQGGPGAGGQVGFGGSTFESTGETITFTISDDTAVTLEYLQGSGEGTIKDIAAGTVLEVTLDSDNHAAAVTVRNLNAGGGFGGSGEVTNGTSANTIDEAAEITDETYVSTGDNENALRVDGAAVTFDGITVEKNGGESANTEDGDFYGQNAAFLALNGAEVTIQNAIVNTSAVNGNGVFSYGEGTVVNISDSTIRTTERNSGGIQTTGGGTTNASNLDVETQGNSAAAIRSDRGGGIVKVDGGTYTTNGTGSPAVYCTADISVSNATLTANASEGVVVEGKNSVALKDCDVTASMSNTYNGDSEENIHAIMIYQSMSGDAEVGEAYFSAEGGSITSKAGDMFYITNTDCEISLKNVVLNLANDILFRIEGNTSSRGWGTQGANGGDVILTADCQKLNGTILVDSISSLDFTMKNASELNGAINPDGEGGMVNVVLESGSYWNMTGDSYITSFDGDTADIITNGYHLYVNGEQVL